jgi:hypothetical protein
MAFNNFRLVAAFYNLTDRTANLFKKEQLILSLIAPNLENLFCNIWTRIIESNMFLHVWGFIIIVALLTHSYF